MITITPMAAEQIRAALAESEEEGLNLRIAARQTPDGGIEYGMGLDEVRENDMNFNCEGVEVLLGPSSRELLAGVILDFVEYQPGDFRFIFVPPSSCSTGAASGGCGSGGCGGCGGGR
ncbi:MAG: iron-sulfur cluster assembly accessory protein [Rhodocyclaceae bacterium]|nr:iron-sulfur cluster assembly accessory protein [Rhodocyclaceae bacterium]